MTKSVTNPNVDFYFTKTEKWKDEIQSLRTIALSSGLTEELKWGCPCYTLEKNNIILIHTFKEYCAFLFFKGALLKDPKNILVQQTKNVQAARQIRFTNTTDILKIKSSLMAYIKEAIAIEKAGLKVELKKTEEFPMPVEFKVTLKENPTLKKAFFALTPGRQRAYLLHFSSAKQVNTREARIEKAVPFIMKGKGLND